MKVSLIMVGKTDFRFIEEGETMYSERIGRYISFEKIVIKDVKNRKSLEQLQIKKLEGIEILNRIQQGDYVVLLDDKGKEFNSMGFSSFIESKILTVPKRLVFIIGGAYGFSDEVYQMAKEKLSVSKMTFSHQIVRLIFLEQLYRAFTIIKGEPYHHE
jgi:23S rRNA (pseudouridine1915-N3)-methyltransferase